MSFQEAVIVPLEIFRKCKFDNVTQKPDGIIDKNILQNKKCPIDTRIKLFQQAKNLKIRSNDDSTLADKNLFKEKLVNTIIQSLPVSSQPYVQAILDKIKENKAIIDWNSEFQLIIHGKVIPNTNFIDLIHFFMNNKIVTSDADIPNRSNEFYDSLIEIGIPKTWIKRTALKKRLKRSKIPVASPYARTPESTPVRRPRTISSWMPL